MIFAAALIAISLAIALIVYKICTHTCLTGLVPGTPDPNGRKLTPQMRKHGFAYIFDPEVKRFTVLQDPYGIPLLLKDIDLGSKHLTSSINDLRSKANEPVLSRSEFKVLSREHGTKFSRPKSFGNPYLNMD